MISKIHAAVTRRVYYIVKYFVSAALAQYYMYAYLVLLMHEVRYGLNGI